ncbi:IS1 family transposase [Mucilaginibacter glaciei]|uniref:IS1 family transposase n=1 Tax=Mucilaginibacter glaciei TaxID=2772109 RepID=A0A926S2H3_9SPHI|nr:IS1 family transposase [Mucilaginibacter glaciei]MBD1395125.1 IS1 family transposase [Mucilaginibacter glaciei]
MFDISKQNIDIGCPQCGRNNSVTLAQVAQQATITCAGCRRRITLKDKNGSAGKSVRDINNAIRDFENTLKKLGR